MKTAKYRFIQLPANGGVLPNITDYVLTSENEQIKVFCEPLHQLGIHFFVYIRRCNNTHYLHLTNNTKWLSEFLNLQLYLQCAFHHPASEFCVGNYLWDGLSSQNVVSEQLRHKFGITNILTQIQPHNDCQEFFCFGSSAQPSDAMNIYINHFNLLQRFILCFKDKYYKEIDKKLNTRVVIPEGDYQYAIAQKNTEQLQSIYHLTDLERLYLGIKSSEIYLTRREAEALKWYVQGKTMCEIAMILGLSSRTIETHFNRIKQKTDCYTRAQLIMKYSALLEI